MNLQSMTDLLLYELSDLYDAEQQALQVYPKLIEAAFSTEFREVLETHCEETKKHVERLDQIYKHLKTSPQGSTCKAMKGLIAEANELLQQGQEADPNVLDAALVGAAQRMEHYEIAGYGCARSYAQIVGAREIARLLQDTLDEEGETDKKLTLLAESMINPDAAEADKEILTEAGK
jgi:ferritin-like metal-binding protein YciE